MDDEPQKKKRSFQIGQDLSELSVDEIKETITELEEEIVRLQDAAGSKSAHLSAAEALFKS